MNLEGAVLIIDFDDKLSDEITADDPVEIMAEPCRQPPEWHRQGQRLRKPFQAGQRPVPILYHRGGQSFGSRTTDTDLAFECQPKLFGHLSVDDANFVASVEHERERSRVVYFDLQ